MPLSLRALESREVLETFLARPEILRWARFQQTWEWGDYEAANGNRVERLGMWDGDRLQGTCLLVTKRDHIATFVHCPRGPVVDWDDTRLATAVVGALVAHVARSGVAYLRCDPPLLRGSGQIAPLRSSGFRRAGRLAQVERAWMIDIDGRSDADLLAWMREHGMRSNIPRYLRRAERLGVEVRRSVSSQDMDTFIRLTGMLDERKGGIGMLPPAYYRRQLEAMGSTGRECLFVAEHQGEAVAAVLIAVFGGEGSYLHGASSSAHPELHAPHYLHWQVMRHLRDAGVRRYNMWGVVSDRHHRPGHRGYGFSEFKRSFGGYIEHYERSLDHPFNRLIYPLVWAKDAVRGWQGQMD
ncbi:MAG: lipid II:glycine glycyltransferase FemX [Candidatus Dormibacteria bacterium]